MLTKLEPNIYFGSNLLRGIYSGIIFYCEKENAMNFVARNIHIIHSLDMFKHDIIESITSQNRITRAEPKFNVVKVTIASNLGY